MDAERLDALCDELSGEQFYAIDTEFHTERTYWPALALIQFAWQDEVALVDPLAVDPAPLRRLFEGPGTAVAHAAGQDLDILRRACGAAPERVFDTQVAAGFLGISSPSLGRLVDLVLGISLPKADQLSDWLQRPLPASQLAYAAGDVEHLLALRAAMVERLRQRGRLDWALEECQQVLPGQRRSVLPEEAWWKVGDVRRLTGRARGVAQEVTAWRERRAAEVDRPRRSVLSDLAVLTIAQRPPRNRQELAKLRGVDERSLARGGAAEILEAVERGTSRWLRTSCTSRPTPPSRRPPRSPWPCVPGSSARSPRSSTSTRDSSLPGPTSPSWSSASRAASTTGGAATSPAAPSGGLLAGEVSAAFDARGQLVLEARSHVPAGPRPHGRRGNGRRPRRSPGTDSGGRGA